MMDTQEQTFMIFNQLSVNVTIQLMDNRVRLPGRQFSKLYCPLCLRFHSDQVFSGQLLFGRSGGVIRPSKRKRL